MYHSVGLLPLKKDPENIFIQDGTNSENDWIRFYSLDEIPRVENPDKGYCYN